MHEFYIKKVENKWGIFNNLFPTFGNNKPLITFTDQSEALKIMNIMIQSYEFGHKSGEIEYSYAYNKGHDEGFEEGYDESYNERYDKGYDDGYEDGLNANKGK